MTGTNKSNWKEPLLLQEGLGDSSYCELYFLVKNLSLGEKTIPNDKEESDDNSHKLPSDLVQKICQYFFAWGESIPHGKTFYAGDNAVEK